MTEWASTDFRQTVLALTDIVISIFQDCPFKQDVFPF